MLLSIVSVDYFKKSFEMLLGDIKVGTQKSRFNGSIKRLLKNGV